ncbi:MAG: S8 family serine peptidase [Ignavibacteriales bacterium]
MGFVRSFTKRTVLIVTLFFLTASLFAQEGTVRLLLSVKRADFSKVEQAILALKGQVNIKHKFVDVLAVTIPISEASKVISMPEVAFSEKDMTVTIPEPPKASRVGNDNMPQVMSSENAEELSAEQLKKNMEITPNGYYPFTNQLTEAYQFSQQTGHYGEGVIIGVIDAGVATSAIAVGSRVIGGENFTNDGISATSASNGQHGTWVACCIGASAVFVFNSNAVAQAVERYAPGSTIPNFNNTGKPGVPMIGQAPQAQFYALKVFPYNSNSTSRSIIASAMERAVELKEQYNAGGGGVNIRIINMSLGGLSFYAGRDPFYQPLVKRAQDAGILIVTSAGNDGPSGMTIGTPGDSYNIITSGSTSDATHERIVSDLFYYGPNSGFSYRPLNNNLIADYSSRGPNADGRPDPDLVAPGTWRYVQGANSGISWASGTSFSAPTISGAAALLISAYPNATPNQLRAALLNGAQKGVLDGDPGREDQGYGFLNVWRAYQKLTAGTFNPPDIGIGSPFVPVNVVLENRLVLVNSLNYSASTGMLRPGERAEYFYPVSSLANKVTVNISNVTRQLPANQQNPLFGDDLYVGIVSAVTSRAVYRQGTPAFVGSDKTYVLQGQDLSTGLARITIMGDWTNAGSVSANVNIQTELKAESLPLFRFGTLAEGDVRTYTMNVPSGTSALQFKLKWNSGWDKYPTNDLDMQVYDPNGNLVLKDYDGDGQYDGQSIFMPEILSIANPVSGQWTVKVLGFTVFQNQEMFQLYAGMNGQVQMAKEAIAEKMALPTEFKLHHNMPNPFNPSTTIKYELPVNTFATLRVYNSLGQLIRTLVNEQKEAGVHSAYFDGRDERGRELSSGIYIYQLSAGNFVQSGKMMMVK